MDQNLPEAPEQKTPEDMKTFDMYHFFSRKDVIAMIVLIVLLLAYVLFQFLMKPEVV